MNTGHQRRVTENSLEVERYPKGEHLEAYEAEREASKKLAG
jgi:hypothetical protein